MKISKARRQTLAKRIEKPGHAGPVLPDKESAAPTSARGIDQNAETAPGPCQSNCQTCLRYHASGLSMSAPACRMGYFRSTSIPRSRLFANRRARTMRLRKLLGESVNRDGPQF